MRTISRSAIIVSALILAGCGSSNRIRIEGVLLKSGAPFTPPEGHSNQVVLIAVDVKDDQKQIGTDEPFAAVVDQAAATFEVPGPEGRGIPPGKYRVAVTQMQRTRRVVEKPKRRGEAVVDRDTDLLKERYSTTHSPFVVELTTSQKLTIDLDHPPISPSH